METKHYREHKPALFNRYRGCQACKDDFYDNLVIHHISYERYGHEELSDLVLLCASCHNEFHKVVSGKSEDLQRMTKLFIRNQGTWSGNCFDSNRTL